MFKIRYRGDLSPIIGDSKMKKLKLPVIKAPLTQPKILSMDDYLKFVQFNLKHAFDKKAHAKWKKMLAVNVAFSLK